MLSDRAHALPRTLALAYVVLIAYACLHPMTGWESSGLPLFDYLLAPWPRYFRTEDLVVNVLGYIPLGFVLVPALGARAGVRGAVFAATLVATFVSLSIETTQNFLPSRIASNVDLGCNTLGALIGALIGGRWGVGAFAPGGLIGTWREARVIGGRTGDFGLVLVGLWLLTQAMPETPPFSAGDLRQLLGLPAPLPFSPLHFMRLEGAVVASGMLGAGLLARCLLRGPGPAPIAVLLLLGVSLKTLFTHSFLEPGSASAWITPGAVYGMLVGGALLVVALLLPRIVQHALAGMALLITTTLANLMPDNPYLLLQQQTLMRGNFLNFHGLIQLVATAWPFLALGYLSALGLWRGQHLSGH